MLAADYCSEFSFSTVLAENSVHSVLDMSGETRVSVSNLLNGSERTVAVTGVKLRETQRSAKHLRHSNPKIYSKI